MEHAIYLKCRNPVMTYVDPQTKFKIPRGKIVKYTAGLTKTMQRWIRRGGLKRVEEALYLKQQEADSKDNPAKPVAADAQKSVESTAVEKKPDSNSASEEKNKPEKKTKKGKK